MKLIKKGVNTAIRDNGLEGKYRFGISSMTVIDKVAFRILNMVLGNQETEACLEFYFPAPTILFEESITFSISGADFEPMLNGKRVALNREIKAEIGDILSFKRQHNGRVAYFGVKNGFSIDSFEGSKSFNQCSDDLSIAVSTRQTGQIKSTGIKLRKVGNQNLKFVPNHIFYNLGQDFQNEFFSKYWILHQDSNRMATRFKNRLNTSFTFESQVSDFVQVGTVQLLPNGEFIILMSDAQMTGGYLNIGFVSKYSLSLLSQMHPQAKVKFDQISFETSIIELLEFEKQMERLEKNYRLYAH